MCPDGMRTDEKKRYRNWIWVCNNWTEADIALFNTVECGYIAYSKEIAASGTPHLQGYIHFKDPKSFKRVRGIMVGCHVDPMRGSFEQNDEYIALIKGGDLPGKEVVERGVRPKFNDDKGFAEQLRWHTMREHAKNNTLDQIDAKAFIQNYTVLKRIAKDYMKKPEALEGCCGMWIHGPSGVGKTHRVVTEYPDRYIKSNTKWWDGYQNEDTVHLDEVGPDDLKWGIANYLKKWGDKWPFSAETKGGACQLRPQRFIVTSNYSIDEMSFDFRDTEAIKNRFKEYFIATRTE